MILSNTLFLSGADVCVLYVCIFWHVCIQKIPPISVCMKVRVIYCVFAIILPLLLIIIVFVFEKESLSTDLGACHFSHVELNSGPHVCTTFT